MHGAIDTSPNGDGGSDVAARLRRARRRRQIDAVDFIVRNYVGTAGRVPELELGPDQFVAVASRAPARRNAKRFRAAGPPARRPLRSPSSARAPTTRRSTCTTDVGDGTRPLRALVDLDNRGPGAAGRRQAPDASTRRVHAAAAHDRTLNYRALARDAPTPTRSSTTRAVDRRRRRRASSPTRARADGCGEAKVTCLKARIDQPAADARDRRCPARAARDFSLSHTGTGARPARRARDDRPHAGDAADRTYADVELLRVPDRGHAAGWTTTKGVAARRRVPRLHVDFAAEACARRPAGARPRQLHRPRPARRAAALPPRPDTVPNFVTLVARPDVAIAGDERFEVAGRVDEVRNVAFRQRDVDDDGEADGTLGARVDVGAPNTPFDAVVDTAGFARDPTTSDATRRAQPTCSVGVDELPAALQRLRARSSTTRRRRPRRACPPTRCWRSATARRARPHRPASSTSTPLSVAYQASARRRR